MNGNSKQNYFYFAFIVLIFAADRITKIIILNIFKSSDFASIKINSFLNFSLVWNDGIAFGLFSDNNQIFYNIISVIILLIIAILFYYMLKTENYKKYVYMIIIGGALGNLFDRIIYNSVPDFIDLHYQGFHWFVFNVADIFITFGVICLIYDEVFLEKNRNEDNV